MIGECDLRARVAAWALREDVVEKDYLPGWVWQASAPSRRSAAGGSSRAAPASKGTLDGTASRTRPRPP